MERNQISHETIICDSCTKEVNKSDIKFLPVKTCCSIKRIPLCEKCWEQLVK